MTYRRDVLESAESIARRDLLRCLTSEGIIAGTHHFVDLWARDGLFACLGALEVGEYTAVKTTIESFLAHQRRDGLIPYRVLRSRSTIGKYLGKPAYLPN